MAENHILAVHTYGSQRVKNPRTKAMVSAYKIGYSSAACETLLHSMEQKHGTCHQHRHHTATFRLTGHFSKTWLFAAECDCQRFSAGGISNPPLSLYVSGAMASG